MVRILEAHGITADKQYIEAFGLSTDTKPTEGIVTGSVFVEVNTKDVYMFNETSGEWVKFNGTVTTESTGGDEA